MTPILFERKAFKSGPPLFEMSLFVIYSVVRNKKNLTPKYMKSTENTQSGRKQEIITGAPDTRKANTEALYTSARQEPDVLEI